MRIALKILEVGGGVGGFCVSHCNGINFNTNNPTRYA
jgi:hypothetical protein